MEKLQNIIPSLIGVIGTLSGVILGVLLKQVLSAGKIKVFVNNFELTFSENDNGNMKDTKIITQKSECASLDADIDVYNSSSDQRIMRDICFLIQKKNYSRKISLKDRKTSRISSFRIAMDTVDVITIPPKTVVNLKLSAGSREELNQLVDSNIFFHFKNNKQKSITQNLCDLEHRHRT
jgi:hypothetical protein